MHRFKTLVGALALSLLVPGAALAQPNTGSANFTRYYALGDSLTAGFQSGGLGLTGQRSSYPFLLYRQATGLTTGFEQPTVSDPGLPSVLELRNLAPLSIAPKAGQGSPTNLTLARPYNNLGVPGARLRDTLVTHTGGLHDLVLRPTGFGNTTALQQAVLSNPTFVTIWIGNNDVLAAATSGVVIEGVTLTPVAQFETDLRTLVTTLVTAVNPAPRLALATIPDVTTIAFVNTLTRFVPNPATGAPVLINGQPVPLIGPNGPLTANDHVLLTASAELAKGNGIPVALGGSGQPLPDTAFLTGDELATISARVTAYNNIIRAVANERNAALAETNAMLTRAAQGKVGVGGMTFTPAFLTGGIFSYDGVHPTNIGYAFVANAFIEAINAKFGAAIPPVNLFPYILGGASRTTAADSFSDEGTPAFIFTDEAKQSLFQALRIDPNPKRPGKGGKGGKGGKK